MFYLILLRVQIFRSEKFHLAIIRKLFRFFFSNTVHDFALCCLPSNAGDKTFFRRIMHRIYAFKKEQQETHNKQQKSLVNEMCKSIWVIWQP